MKALNKWWDGYDNEQVIIIEDVDSFAAGHLGHALKIWADEAHFSAEVKGGTLKIRPLLIIVTSNYLIEDLWPNDLILQAAIKRRFFQPEINRREDFGTIIWPENFSTIHNAPSNAAPSEGSSPSIPPSSEDGPTL